ncbi:amidohydrolase family protein [Balneolales bacterium ANBcel1]|nr:amidohydrolase family protein [Balneolales bacterium ANBcel1]
MSQSTNQPRLHSRKDFLIGAGAGIILPFIPGSSGSAQPNAVPNSGRYLLKGGTVLTMDDDLGDFDSADVLVEDGVISAVAASVNSDAEVIDAAGHIVLPGFVDSHRHMWQGCIRNMLPDGLLSDYVRVVLGQARPVYRPDDAHIGTLISALGAIDAGVTTVLDWSHIGKSPAHTDAAVRGLRDSGIRALYAYGSGDATPENRYPDDLRRLRDEVIPPDDPLLTLALGAGINAGQWELARETGVRISVHVNGTGDLLPMTELLGPDVTCIHCCNLLDEEWELLAANRTGVSISSPVEMIMGHGIPPIQQTLDYGILPSLSVDVETTVPGNMFTQMQSVQTLQRMQILARDRAGESDLPDLLTAREILRFATVNGAIHNGLDHLTGTLTPGKQADIQMLSLGHINTMPVNSPYGAVVTGMDRTNVDMVMVAGDIKKWKGKLVRTDLDQIASQALRSRDGIFERAGLHSGI